MVAKLLVEIWSGKNVEEQGEKETLDVVTKLVFHFMRTIMVQISLGICADCSVPLLIATSNQKS